MRCRVASAGWRMSRLKVTRPGTVLTEEGERLRIPVGGGGFSECGKRGGWGRVDGELEVAGGERAGEGACLTGAGEPAVRGGDAMGGEDQLRSDEERVRAQGEGRRAGVGVAPAHGDGVPAVGLDLGSGRGWLDGV